MPRPAAICWNAPGNLWRNWPRFMLKSLEDICCACVPAGELGRLAPLRCEPGLVVAKAGDWLWVKWHAQRDETLRVILPIPGCRLFRFCKGHWVQHGRHLPEFEVPNTEYRPLAQVLFPAPITTLPTSALRAQPLHLTLAADANPRPTTALRISVAALLHWAESIPSDRLSRLRGAYRKQEAFVVGAILPSVVAGQRYWGRTVYVPLGFRPEPDLADSSLREVLGLQDGEWAILEDDGVQVVREEDMVPVSRAGLRLASGSSTARGVHP